MTVATDKAKVTVYLEFETHRDLRVMSAKHLGSTLSSITEDMIEHCSSNKAFLAKISAKYSPKKEEDCEI